GAQRAMQEGASGLILPSAEILKATKRAKENPTPEATSRKADADDSDKDVASKKTGPGGGTTSQPSRKSGKSGGGSSEKKPPKAWLRQARRNRAAAAGRLSSSNCRR